MIAQIQVLEKQGIGFRSLTEQLDTTTAGGRLFFHIFGALSESERELIRERTRAGLDAARARGRVGGRPRVMTAQRVEQARRMRVDGGHTLDEIASVLGVGRSSVVHALTGATSAAAPDATSLPTPPLPRSPFEL